jgi:hypothetical protein
MSKKYRIDISDDEMIVYGSVYWKDLKIIYKFLNILVSLMLELNMKTLNLNRLLYL